MPKKDNGEVLSKKGSGYFDLSLESDSQMWELSEIFYIKDLMQRKLYLDGTICQESVIDVIHHILQYNREDVGLPLEKRKPIILYLTTNGGSVDVGFRLIDTILSSKTPVHIVNNGYWYSMGVLIGIAGDKRYATKNARFLIHDGFNMAVDSSSKVKDQIDFQKRFDERMKQYVIERTKINEEEYEKNLRVEWYMFADEAKEKGVVDYIIGEDCDIDEIV